MTLCELTYTSPLALTAQSVMSVSLVPPPTPANFPIIEIACDFGSIEESVSSVFA